VVLITYEMSYKIANTSWVQLAFSGVLIAAVCRFHSTLREVILVQFALMIVLLVLVGTPFVKDALRSEEAAAEDERRPIRIIRRVTEDEVILEFLRSDFEDAIYEEYYGPLHSIVYAPNLANPAECAKRRALLFLRHLSLWKELPNDTEWFEAEIAAGDLEQIQVFPRAQWRKIAKGNFVITDVAGVVERMRTGPGATDDPFLSKIGSLSERLEAEEPIPGSVILIGLNESEPLTVIDGNHRLLAAVLQGRMEKLRFLCGLSPKMTQCCWYRTNVVTLARYGGNLLRQATHRPQVELARLFENPG
jgi:hypothetical protein